MRNSFTVSINDIKLFKSKVLQWLQHFTEYAYLDNNFYTDYQYRNYELLVGAGVYNKHTTTNDKLLNAQAFLHEHEDWKFGHLAYDLKNQIEHLTSQHEDTIGFNDLFLFIPQHVIYLKAGSHELVIESHQISAEDIFNEIQNQVIVSNAKTGNSIHLISKFSKEEYIETVNLIKEKIAAGDFYEMNLCMEFFVKNTAITPLHVFEKLNALNESPFAALYKVNECYAICSSPERFLSKQNNTLISQPIKGTCKRTTNIETDNANKQQLHNSEKEKAENVMIVDLVRNDLTKSCITGTIKVPELFGIYTFKRLHHMVSTIKGKAKNDVNFIQHIQHTFPMGSMTGAPKYIVMQTIEELEKSKRGLYSGSIGYIQPNGDFDFNVVIRSILYNAEKNTVSFQVGSAITFDSDAEKEYEECLLKAEAMMLALK